MGTPPLKMATLPPHPNSCKLRIEMSKLSPYCGGLHPIVEMPGEQEFEQEDSFYFVKNVNLENVMLRDDDWSSDDELADSEDNSNNDSDDDKSDSDVTDPREEHEEVFPNIADTKDAVLLSQEDIEKSVLKLREAFRKSRTEPESSSSDTESREGTPRSKVSPDSSRASTPTDTPTNSSPEICCPRPLRKHTINSSTERNLQKYWLGRLDESMPNADEWVPRNPRACFESFRPVPPTPSMESFDFGDKPNSLWKPR